MTERFLTIREVAEELRVSRMTIYRLVHEGELESQRISKRTIRISKSALERYLKSQEED